MPSASARVSASRYHTSALRHLRRVGLGVDVPKAVERFRLEPALPALPGQGERLAGVLHGLINATRQETDRAAPRDKKGLQCAARRCGDCP